MTATSNSAQILQAAVFIQRHHGHLAIDHPAMEMATDTLRAAGIWSLADVGLPLTAKPPTVAIVVKGTFCTGDRRRIVYRLLADDQEIGTAVCWPARILWPWGLTIASANIVNFGFRDKTSLIRAVERFVRTGEIVQ